MKEPEFSAEREQQRQGVEWAELVRIVFVALAAAAVWFRLWEPFPHISVIGVAATLIGGYPIFNVLLSGDTQAATSSVGCESRSGRSGGRTPAGAESKVGD